MAIIALTVITGLMATGVIVGYTGGWMWATFALSLSVIFIDDLLLIPLVIITVLMATGGIVGYAGGWMWAVFGLSMYYFLFGSPEEDD